MILLKNKTRQFDIVLLQTYVPTKDHTDELLEEYYEDLPQTFMLVKSSEVLIVMGVMNAKVKRKKCKQIVG